MSAAAAAAVREAVGVINEEVERLNKIVVDYLFAVRPINVDLELGDLNDVLLELLRFLRPELAAAGIEVREELADRLPLVPVDQRYLREALLNIIKNAIAAMVDPPAGERRRRRVLTVASSTDGESVTIRIRDTGVGILPTIQDKIFEPYFTTRDFGSGLGLTLVYKIVKEHRGEITLDSKPGVGTTFSISLPIPQPEKRLLAYAAATV